MIYFLAAGVAMCIEAHIAKSDCTVPGEVDADRFIEEVLPASGSPGGVWLSQGRPPEQAIAACATMGGDTPLKAVPVFGFTARIGGVNLGTYFACMHAPTS